MIVTLGKKGALLCEGGRCEVIPAHRVEAVDTTAAGDVFNAGLVVALSEGKNLTDAVRFGAKAAAISVTRMEHRRRLRTAAKRTRFTDKTTLYPLGSQGSA